MHDHKKTNKFTNTERMLLPSDALGSHLQGPSPMAKCHRCGPILLEKGPVLSQNTCPGCRGLAGEIGTATLLVTTAGSISPS